MFLEGIISQFNTDILHIGNFINNHIDWLIIISIFAVISAGLCAVITKLRRGSVDDIVFSVIFGLVFNIFGVLFVFFRKPVWNNLGWIPVVVAWFFIDPSQNTTLALILIAYAIIWAFAQHFLLERIQVIEE